ncbi:AGAP000607-PA-like protein [Anopheles sinensis]|uniref:AGAP000607-PA-like protein n=1 Tax=Anopheles sinensis TaxID=74873 RepID=A0A084VLJ1_ANOSI|nr:AGAP000607-PA-like protein [Anopheles sinensis]
MEKLTYRCLYVLSLLWCVAHAAPNPTEQKSSAQGNVCGQHYNDIYAAAKSWQTKGIVPEHETQYKELKEKCAQAHKERQEKQNAVTTKLPTYMSNIVVALSSLNSTLRTEVSTLEEIVQNQHESLANAWQYGLELQHELLVTNIESDRIEKALLYHSILQDSSPKQIVTESYAYHGSHGKMVALLLKFVRSLPAKTERVEAYTELERLLKSNGQNERFPAVIFSQDVKELGDQGYNPDHTQLEGKAVARWQSLLLAGNFSEIVLFAQDHPSYYARIESTLIDALNKAWSKEALEKVIYFPNVLPNSSQRVAALKGVLKTLLAHQDKQLNDLYLMKLAKELEKLEHHVEASGDTQAKESLKEVKDIFGKFSYTRNFSNYVDLYGMLKSAL